MDRANPIKNYYFLKISQLKKKKKDPPCIRHTWYFSFSSFPAAHQPHGLEGLEGALTICKASAKARAAVRGEHLPAAQRACQCCRKALIALPSPSDNMTLCDASQGMLVRIALRTLLALMTPKIFVQN